jgi:2,4-dienoyl-CoA reductase-like NADH-dependent reductase (Old Yellow Enzyme family)
MTPPYLAPLVFPRAGISARNRVALAAMTNKQSHADGELGDDELAWLTARACGGFGIVTTCATNVTADGKAWDGELAIDRDELLPGLRRLAAALHAEGAVSLVQLFHGGVRAPSRLTGVQPFSASEFELDVPNFERPRAATNDDIARIIAAFAAAAARAAKAGFDGVELHGAHGYLLSQFLGTITNRRTDEWGGDLAGRARLVREVLRRCRAAVPSRFLVGVRISPEIAEQGIALEDSLELARWLVADGADFVHVSNWDSFQPPEAVPTSDRRLTAWFRDAVGPGPILFATGAIWTPSQARTVMADGADVIGLGRAAIGYPDWPRRAADETWQPARPPFSPAHLADAGLGSAFIDYMRRWPGFVTDGR